MKKMSDMDIEKSHHESNETWILKNLIIIIMRDMDIIRARASGMHKRFVP